MNPYAYPGLVKKYNTFEAVLQVVASFYDIEKEEIFSIGREQKNVEPRRLVYFLVKKNQIEPLLRTSRRFNQNHATGLYHVKTFENMFETDKNFRNKIISII